MTRIANYVGSSQKHQITYAKIAPSRSKFGLKTMAKSFGAQHRGNEWITTQLLAQILFQVSKKTKKKYRWNYDLLLVECLEGMK